MSSITVTHAPSGLVHAHVARTERVTPHMVRVTLTGDDLRRFDYRGFDQWFRLAVPVDDHARFDNLPDKFDTRSYLRYLVLPKSTRPVIRNYTVRAFRPDAARARHRLRLPRHRGRGRAVGRVRRAGRGGRVHRPGLRLGPRAGGLVAAGRRRVRAARPSSASCGTCRATPSGTRSSSSSTPRTRRTSTPRRDDPALGVRRPTGGTALDRLREIDWLPGRRTRSRSGESRIATGARRYLGRRARRPQGQRHVLRLLEGAGKA